MPPLDPPERRARQHIDAMLGAAGWAVQDRSAMNLAAAAGVAIRELPTSAGPADYMLFLRNFLVGVVEAKKEGVTLSSVEAQTREYARMAPRPLQVPVRPLPFLYESTGVETWFTNGFDPDPCARSVFSFHRPETLRGPRLRKLGLSDDAWGFRLDQPVPANDGRREIRSGGSSGRPACVQTAPAPERGSRC